MNKTFAKLAAAGFFIVAIAAAIVWQEVSPPPSVSLAQSGTIAAHAVPISKGPGVTGYGAAAPGAVGTVLASQGPSADPAFQALTALGVYANQYTTISGGALTASGLLGKVLGDSASSQSNTLPAASSMPQYALIFQHQQSGSWTITRAGSDGIFGPNNWNGTSIALPNLGDFVALFSDGGNWHVIAGSPVVTGGFATAAQYFAGTSPNTMIPPSSIYNAETATSYGATTTFDFSTFLNTSVTLTGNITTMSVANVKAGQAGTITFVQDGTGNRTTVWNSVFKFAGGSTPTLSTAANAVDVLSYSCRTATFCVASLLQNVR